MEDYVSTGIGVVVSIALFFLGYRQTIGAKRERVKSANQVILRSILRRIVLEEYTPSLNDLSRFIAGKAREFNVSPGDVYSEEQILTSLFSEVFDSDLIPSTQRTEIENRIESCFQQMYMDQEGSVALDPVRLELENKRARESLLSIVLLASLAGATVTVTYSYLRVQSFEPSLLLSGLSVLIASVGFTTALAIFRKTKESELGDSKSSAQAVNSRFEAEVAKVLKKNKFPFEMGPRIGSFIPDFVISLNGKKIAIEAKAWDGPVSISQMRPSLDALRRLVSSDKVHEVIVVTKGEIPVGRFQMDDHTIKIVSLANLASTLKQAA